MASASREPSPDMGRWAAAPTNAAIEDVESPAAKTPADAADEARAALAASRCRWHLSGLSMLVVVIMVGMAMWTQSPVRPAPPRGASELFELRAPGTGCSNCPDNQIGEVSYEWEPAFCAMRCKETEGCIGFGWQQHACLDPTKGTAIAGTCMLWKGQCQSFPNFCWDDYAMVGAEMSAPPGQTPSPALPSVPAPPVRLPNISLEGVDMQKLESNPALRNAILAQIRMDLAAGMGVPEDMIDVNLTSVI